MKSASSITIQEELYDIINGSRSFPTAKLEYYDKTTSTWETFKDVESVSFSNTSENMQYGKAIFTPSANQASASFNNARGKYSPGSGGEFDGVLKRNLKVRASVGYVVKTPKITTYNYSGTGLRKYHTTVSIGDYKSDSIGTDSFLALDGITDTWALYGTALYGTSVYSADGYFLSDVIQFNQQDTLNYFDLTSDSATVYVYYRTSEYEQALIDNAVAWQSLGALSVGSNSFNLNDNNDRYFQFCLVFTSGVYGDSIINDIGIRYNDNTEDFEQGEFFLDDPTFSSSFGENSCSFSARDVFKKAFETSVSLPTYTSATDLGQMLRDTLDRANIPHNDGVELVPNTTYTRTVADAENWQNIRAIDILNEIMFYLYSKDSTYRLIRKDGNIALVQVSNSDTSPDWVIDYRFNMSSLSKSYLSDKLLQRATFLSKEHTVDPEAQLATGSYTTTGTKTLTWSNDSMYTRIETTGTATISNFLIDSAGKTLSFDIDAITGPYTLTIYGCKHTSGFTGYFGEQLYYDNAIEADGFTQKIVNRLIASDSEAQALATAYIQRYGNPQFNATISLNCNPMLEIGDRLLVWDKYTYSNTIYRIESISISFSASGAQLTQTLTLSDLGITVDPLFFQWDGGNLFDSGYIWDQDLGVSVTSDPNTYTPIARF